MKRILESDILNRGLGGVVQTDSPPLALFSEREPQINLFQDQIKKPQKIQFRIHSGHVFIFLKYLREGYLIRFWNRQIIFAMQGIFTS